MKVDKVSLNSLSGVEINLHISSGIDQKPELIVGGMTINPITEELNFKMMTWTITVTVKMIDVT